MKKALTFILAILYMSSSTGATFHMHYCMGKLMEVQLWHQETACSKCSARQHDTCAKKCCKDEHKTVKLEKDQQATEHIFYFMQLPAVTTPFSFAALPQSHMASLATAYPISHAPPRSSKVPSHILNCIFRI
jgi:hypothetical protein